MRLHHQLLKDVRSQSEGMTLIELLVAASIGALVLAGAMQVMIKAVSYTHLTLPTICSV